MPLPSWIGKNNRRFKKVFKNFRNHVFYGILRNTKQIKKLMSENDDDSPFYSIRILCSACTTSKLVDSYIRSLEFDLVIIFNL